MRSARQAINEANPNLLASAIQSVRLGDGLGLIPRRVRGAVASNVLVLPEDAKAEVVLRAFVTAGTVSGHFSPSFDPDGVPATTTAGVNPAGNICFLSTDAVTEAEVVYVAVDEAGQPISLN